MNETLVTVVGNVATTPVYRELPSGPVARFRLAVTARYYDGAKSTWTDGHTNFFTVWAWRALGTNVQGSVSVGEPVIVQGRLKVRDEERGGQHWTSADIEAVAIGHDLSRGTAAFRRVGRGNPALTEPAQTQAQEKGRNQGQGDDVSGLWEKKPEPVG
ncbi:single-stranded DNA-binding protein [Streptomyces venezuelae]|uniref:single-stranded DNA-binding protein n=1 Tax=Streptomyces venezuelae TaxID=54571 RepID=UPI00379F7EDA